VVGQKDLVCGGGSSAIANKCGIGPLGIVVSVIDSIWCDKKDRGCVAPAVRAFTKEGRTEHTDTIPTVICRDSKEKGKTHAREH
jgi:hypothetical protein